MKIACLTWLQLFSKSLLLTTPTKVCFLPESKTVSGPPLSPCIKLILLTQVARVVTLQVAECSFSAHSEEWLLKALLENCDWHLSPSTKATSDEIIRYGVTIRYLIPLTKCSISLRLNAIEACHYALYVLCTLGPNGYY